MTATIARIESARRKKRFIRIQDTGWSCDAETVESLSVHPEWYAEMPCATLMEVLVDSPAPCNPFDAAPGETSRTMLASAHHSASDHDTDPAAFLRKVQGALATLADRYADRHLSELTRQIAEAERRSDSAMVLTLMQEKLRLDRERKR
jgi:hypothetical protein